jgi:hypothetical protein
VKDSLQITSQTSHTQCKMILKSQFIENKIQNKLCSEKRRTTIPEMKNGMYDIFVAEDGSVTSICCLSVRSRLSPRSKVKYTT